jgi:hypothetical protein
MTTRTPAPPEDPAPACPAPGSGLRARLSPRAWRCSPCVALQAGIVIVLGLLLLADAIV